MPGVKQRNGWRRRGTILADCCTEDKLKLRELARRLPARRVNSAGEIVLWLNHEEKIAIPFQAWGKAVWATATKRVADKVSASVNIQPDACASSSWPTGRSGAGLSTNS